MLLTTNTPKVIWLYGLSGAGKTTIADALSKKILTTHRLVKKLDGDVLRKGLNNNLGFSMDDRLENIRRSAEVAKLFVESDFITICSFITPTESARQVVREVIGKQNLIEVFVKASLTTCCERDPKGFYKKVQAGTIKDFTGFESDFEYPSNPDLVINTEQVAVDTAVKLIYEHFIKQPFSISTGSTYMECCI